MGGHSQPFVEGHKGHLTLLSSSNSCLVSSLAKPNRKPKGTALHQPCVDIVHQPGLGRQRADGEGSEVGREGQIEEMPLERHG